MDEWEAIVESLNDLKVFFFSYIDPVCNKRLLQLAWLKIHPLHFIPPTEIL